MTQDFLDQARSYLGPEGGRVGNYFCCGLQDFVPEAGRYDLIWIQWVIGEWGPGTVLDPFRFWVQTLTVSGPLQVT